MKKNVRYVEVGMLRLGAHGVVMTRGRSLAITQRSFSTPNAPISASAEELMGSIYKRELPRSLTSLSSPEGKALFREALLAGDMESFFPLSEQFLTQSEPAFCALSSLAMVLNALNQDPGKVWKGIWRWTSEESLRCENHSACGHEHDKFKVNGLNFSEFEGLAACHRVNMLSYRVGDAAKGAHDKVCGKHAAHECHSSTMQRNADNSSDALLKFREYLEESCRSDKAESFVIANFDRGLLGQTGSGHFSPIGGYHREKDLVLVMDVARFKYPPWWVSVDKLWAAMSIGDEQAGEARGYFVCRSKPLEL